MLLRTKVFTRHYGNFGFFEEVIGKVAGEASFFPLAILPNKLLTFGKT